MRISGSPLFVECGGSVMQERAVMLARRSRSTDNWLFRHKVGNMSETVLAARQVVVYHEYAFEANLVLVSSQRRATTSGSQRHRPNSVTSGEA